MDVRPLKDLCQKLDEVAAILAIMEGEPVIVDLFRETSNALNQAFSEIERLRSDTDLHRETSTALRDALAEINRLQADADLHHKTSEALRDALGEIERLRSDTDLHRETSTALRDALAEIDRLRSEAADLQHTKVDEGLSNLPPARIVGATDWFMKFLERKRALTGEKVNGRKAGSSSW